MFKAEVIADSVCGGIRLTTLSLIYPRFIHAEFMTHRVFSRNASSSRAIPVKRMLELVRTEPAMPIHWGKNQSGMQAYSELTEDEIVQAKQLWIEAAFGAANVAEKMAAMGLHKQVANRVLEPFQHMNVVVSSTDWKNFFDLRDHEMAQPEIRVLAQEMKKAMDDSLPVERVSGDWHLPYVSESEKENLLDAVRISAARCARVSYRTFEGTIPKIEEDLKLFDKLAKAEPPHLSPLEHVAVYEDSDKRFGNFRGWKQLRQFHEEGTYAAIR